MEAVFISWLLRNIHTQVSAHFCAELVEHLRGWSPVCVLPAVSEEQADRKRLCPRLDNGERQETVQWVMEVRQFWLLRELKSSPEIPWGVAN